MGSLSNETQDSFAKSVSWALDVASADPSVGTIAGPCGKGLAAACLTCPSRSIGVCSDFDSDEHDRFFDASSRRRVSRDFELVRQGEPSLHVISVVSGALMLSRLTAGGRRFVIDFIWPGEVVGLFAEEKTAFSVVALRPTQVCQHSQPQFESLTEKSPRLARRLLIRENAQVAAAKEHIWLLGCASARERLACFLLRLQERQGRLDKKISTRIDLPMRRSDIAAHLGLTIETVKQIFQDFVSEKIIVAVTNGVRILAREELVAPVGWTPCARREAPPRLSLAATNLDPSFSGAR